MNLSTLEHEKKQRLSLVAWVTKHEAWMRVDNLILFNVKKKNVALKEIIHNQTAMWSFWERMRV